MLFFVLCFRLKMTANGLQIYPVRLWELTLCLYPQMVISKITVFCAAAKDVREATDCLGARRATSSAALGKCAVTSCVPHTAYLNL